MSTDLSTDLSKVMEREQLGSLHAAQCWLDAKRKDNKRAKTACGCLEGTCESKPAPHRCRMADEMKTGGLT